MTEEEELEFARKAAKARLDFYIHLAVYVIVIGMLTGINLVSWTGHYWVMWPAFFWGVALAFHGAAAFLVLGREATIERMARRYVARKDANR